MTELGIAYVFLSFAHAAAAAAAAWSAHGGGGAPAAQSAVATRQPSPSSQFAAVQVSRCAALAANSRHNGVQFQGVQEVLPQWQAHDVHGEAGLRRSHIVRRAHRWRGGGGHGVRGAAQGVRAGGVHVPLRPRGGRGHGAQLLQGAVPGLRADLPAPREALLRAVSHAGAADQEAGRAHDPVPADGAGGRARLRDAAAGAGGRGRALRRALLCQALRRRHRDRPLAPQEHDSAGHPQDPVRAGQAGPAAVHRGAQGLHAVARPARARAHPRQAAVHARRGGGGEHLRAQQQQQGGEEAAHQHPAVGGRHALPERTVPERHRQRRVRGRVPHPAGRQPAEDRAAAAVAGHAARPARHRARRTAEAGRRRARLHHAVARRGAAGRVRHRGQLQHQGQAVPGRAGRRAQRRAALHPHASQGGPRQADAGGQPGGHRDVPAGHRHPSGERRGVLARRRPATVLTTVHHAPAALTRRSHQGCSNNT